MRLIKKLDSVLLVVVMSLSMAFSFSAAAQTLKISGTVKDENGEPLIGAGVSTSDGKTGVVTDMEGKYSITVPASTAILKFSYLSYSTQEVVIDGRSKIDIDMVPDAADALNEVVVIGYGTTKKSDLTGSVATVKMQDISSAPNTSVDQALQGRIAGVDVMSTTGEPGAQTSIRIRGTRSINASNEPLIIVDGVIDAVHDIGEINSSDIESISVMKDASSTAIYGSRGANGVILITTKKGVTSKPSVTAKAEVGVSQIARKLDIMNKDELIRYMNDRYYFINPNSAPRFDPADFPNDTDWMKEITRLALYQNYNLSVSGKLAQKLNYYGALGFNDTKGIIKGSDMKKITGRFNISYDFAKWLTVALKLSYTFRGENLNKANIGGTSFWDGAIYLSPIIGPYDTVNPLYENGTAINTPVVNIEMITKYKEMQTMNDVLEFTIRPCKGLTIKSQNSVMIYQRHDYQFWPSYMPKKVEGQGADAYRYEGDARKFSTENTISYSTKVRGAHVIDALVGFSAARTKTNYFSLKAVGLLTDDLTWNNMAGVMSKENLTPYSTSEEVVKESVFARFNYNYKQRYYFTATGRFDASSNFAANNKWGFFPSAAFKWAMKNEQFLKRVRWIDDMSLRLSAGRTGNDAIAYYRSLAAYSTWTDSYLFDGMQGASMLPSRVANPDLTWEKTTLYNVALDMSFFKGRLGVTIEGYHSDTKDLLLNLKTIQTTGYDSRLTNLGRTSNTGVEVTIDSKNIQKKKFGWSTQFTFTHNKQTVKDIGQEDYVAVLNSPGNTSFMMYGYKKGYPLNALWGFQYAGVWHNQDEIDRNKFTRSYVTNSSAASPLGHPKYVDQNHDGIVSEEDLIYLGNSDPVLYGGLQNTFHIGNLGIGIYFAYSIGGKIYNYSELSMAGSYASNQYRYMLDAWHPVRNPESDIPRSSTDDRMLPSSFQVHDASYLRLKNANITYKFDLSKKTKALRDITLGLSGTNLFLITKYNGFDPDVSTNSEESTLRRVDMGAYPQSRMVVFSVQVRY